VKPGAAVHLLSAAPGFTGPSSWTGIVSPESSLTGAVRNLSGLLSDGDRPPSFLIPIYMAAGHRYHVPWEVLAAINAIESDYGRDLNTSTAGAIGWMQFEPSTWKRYGVAADGVSEANPYDPRDAIFAAARYLQAAGGSTDIRQAVFAYNHADWYVDEVLQRAEAISEHVQYERATVSNRDAVSVAFDTDLKGHPTVRYSSGVLSHFDRLVAAANMVSAAGFRYLWGGGHEQPSRFGAFDCSGSVSYVMQQAGYRVRTTVAADIGRWNLPSGPGRVTIFYSATHTFMRIGGRYFGTSGFARPGGGAGWFDVDRLPAGYLANFHEVHVPGLGIDSFSADAALPLGRAPLTPRARLAARERASLKAVEEARLGGLATPDRQSRLVQKLVSRGVDLLRPAPVS
jgi:cell wall-associated NlpC family hydrolase